MSTLTNKCFTGFTYAELKQKFQEKITDRWFRNRYKTLAKQFYPDLFKKEDFEYIRKRKYSYSDILEKFKAINNKSDRTNEETSLMSMCRTQAMKYQEYNKDDFPYLRGPIKKSRIYKDVKKNNRYANLKNKFQYICRINHYYDVIPEAVKKIEEGLFGGENEEIK